MNDIERVKYGNCPLLEVVYQLNFPTILAIETSVPADFQMKIRKQFPQYKIQMERGGEFTVNVDGPEINPMYRSREGRKMHLFISEDGKWKITLAKNQLSISTLDYKCWEDMNDRFSDVLESFSTVYEQEYFERIGIRYVDSISKKALGIEDKEWNELLKPHLLGCLAMTDSSVSVISNLVQSEMEMEDIKVKLSCGLAQANLHDGTIDNTFIIDCDYFYTGKTEMENIKLVSEKLHQKSTSFFRGSITDKLHYAMNPQSF